MRARLEDAKRNFEEQERAQRERIEYKEDQVYARLQEQKRAQEKEQRELLRHQSERQIARSLRRVEVEEARQSNQEVRAAQLSQKFEKFRAEQERRREQTQLEAERRRLEYADKQLNVERLAHKEQWEVSAVYQHRWEVRVERVVYQHRWEVRVERVVYQHPWEVRDALRLSSLVLVGAGQSDVGGVLLAAATVGEPRPRPQVTCRHLHRRTSFGRSLQRRMRGNGMSAMRGSSDSGDIGRRHRR